MQTEHSHKETCDTTTNVKSGNSLAGNCSADNSLLSHCSTGNCIKNYQKKVYSEINEELPEYLVNVIVPRPLRYRLSEERKRILAKELVEKALLSSVTKEEIYEYMLMDKFSHKTFWIGCSYYSTSQMYQEIVGIVNEFGQTRNGLRKCRVVSPLPSGKNTVDNSRKIENDALVSHETITTWSEPFSSIIDEKAHNNEVVRNYKVEFVKVGYTDIQNILLNRWKRITSGMSSLEGDSICRGIIKRHMQQLFFSNIQSFPTKSEGEDTFLAFMSLNCLAMYINQTFNHRTDEVLCKNDISNLIYLRLKHGQIITQSLHVLCDIIINLISNI